MKSIVIVTAFVIAVNPTIAGQSQETEAEARARLARRAGTWAMQERYAGDPAVYETTSTCRLFPGGLHVVCESEAQAPLGPSTSLGILSYEPARRTYMQFTIASIGVAALMTGTAIDDLTVVSHTEFPFNGEIVKARVTVTDDSSTSWIYGMEASIGGSPTMVIQEAHATRVVESNDPMTR